jgi:uncharacterized Ntn-hydrolase superfamily protein
MAAGAAMVYEKPITGKTYRKWLPVDAPRFPWYNICDFVGGTEPVGPFKSRRVDGWRGGCRRADTENLKVAMKIINCISTIILGWCLFMGPRSAQATFSIVAVDPATGEVGSAGASCVTHAIQISDIHPGVGVIHSQASNVWPNYVHARQMMNDGASPQEIVDWLVANDADGTPTIRQFLIVDLVDGGRSAVYTGVDCDTWKGHLSSPICVVAGNTLLGPEIVANMESAFSNTNGPLAYRMMAAMQAANVPAADTRCESFNKPAESAFIVVARPGESEGHYHLELNVDDTAPEQNPIDILQDEFDAWAASAVQPDVPAPATRVANWPNPFNPGTEIRYWLGSAEEVTLSVFDLRGRELRVLVDALETPGWNSVPWDGRDATGASLPSGVYVARMATDSYKASCRMLLVR